MASAKMTKTKQSKQPMVIGWRFVTVMVVISVVFTALVARAAYLQVIEPETLRKKADLRSLRAKSKDVMRGMITDRTGRELAVSIPMNAIWIDPKHIFDYEVTGDSAIDHQTKTEFLQQLKDSKRWQALAEVLGWKWQTLYDKLVANQNKRFIYLSRQVTPAVANYVDELDLTGVYQKQEAKRFYPTGEISSHLVGFTNIEGKGLEGIEKLYDAHLQGESGLRKIRKDAKGREVEVLQEEKAIPPEDIALSIDQRIQALAYRELKSAVASFKASSGSAVVVDVTTGEILAMVNSPSFNPNNQNEFKVNTKKERDHFYYKTRNRAVTDIFEPGSTLKPLAVLSALEFGLMEIDGVVDTHPGWLRVGGQRVSDLPKNYGKISLETILQKSSNVGVAKLALGVPKEHLLDAFYHMGFGSDTGTGLLGESSGLFGDRTRWSDFEIATLSFGYGIAVSTAQLARMYSILGNHGVSCPLSILKLTNEPYCERVVSEENAQALLNMMVSVLDEDGTAPKAKVEGYRIAGKTGTAKKAAAGGYGNEYDLSFAGVGPVSNPRLAVAVVVNEPGGDYYYGGEVAAPLFSKVMTGALQILNVAPDDKQITTVASTGGRRGN
ncbi:penicillin-binding transpeptidase domain-containing protein [Flocculibacter collagenilyticus]|uniref:penicillin-binding transpeptidase domain-containing protein n=1 Tax=Flocculibacter collagenilyticus TaxID=2744479 RepID=UPI0018F61B6A|nr:penicillin-binding transpeptidase domain-containing protein [Flocculibacter collagenilyticus]